ncbi:MAG: hypothetical protein WC875_01350, partial [Candidatus Absconditabacterales bacterium]
MLTFLLLYALPIIGVIIALVIIFNAIVIVGGSSICLLERRWIGKSMPENRTVAIKNEVGIQARTLGPGFHFLIPFLYKTKKSPFITVTTDQIAYVEAITGEPIPSGSIFAKMVDCNFFMDGEKFLTTGGQKGPQTQILPPGQYRINPFLFKVQYAPVTVIRDNQIGLVESIDGKPVPAGKIFAKTVDCNYYQNIEDFFTKGGEKGPQIQILPPGNYRINPVLFKVKPVNNIIVNQGEVATITAMDGENIETGRLLAKYVEGHSNFEDGDAFLNKGGQKGPQAQILLPGTYRINTSLFIPEIKPATIIPAQKVGLVTAKDGEPLPQDELMAIQITGHDDFQNVAEFLKNKGQRGPQLDILKPGTYYINPFMFDVVEEAVAEVKRGEVAVIISNVGKEHPMIDQTIKDIAAAETNEKKTEISKTADTKIDVGIERYVVPKGYRGIQQEVAGPGIY